MPQCSALLISVPGSVQAAASPAGADALSDGEVKFGLAVAASPIRTLPAPGSNVSFLPALGETPKSLLADASQVTLFAEAHASEFDNAASEEDDLYDLLAADCLQGGL